MLPGVAELMLMYFILPLWLVAGFADYLCHRAAKIQLTSGPKESLIHLLLFAEMAILVVAALLLEINALIIALMIAAFLLHQGTSLWDVSYAHQTRDISPVEQHVHSFLEMLPLMGLLLIIGLHWDQFLALTRLGSAAPDFALKLKRTPLPWTYVIAVLVAALLFEALPYLEELVRSLRSRRERVRESTPSQPSDRKNAPG
jgi:hypothetical protein